MKTQDAIEREGSAKALADLLGITPSAVSQWGERLPAARLWQLRAIRPFWFSADEAAKPTDADPSAAQEGQGAANV